MDDMVDSQAVDLGECYTVCWVVDGKIRFAPVAYKVTALANDHVRTAGGVDVLRESFVQETRDKWRIPRDKGQTEEEEKEYTLTHIFFNGRSLREIYREQYGDAAPGFPHRIYEKIDIHEGDELIVAPVVIEKEASAIVEIGGGEARDWPDGVMR